MSAKAKCTSSPRGFGAPPKNDIIRIPVEINRLAPEVEYVDEEPESVPEPVVNDPLSDVIHDLSPEIILPAQLPGHVVKVLRLHGNTRTSMELVCLLSNGEKYRMLQRHLSSILGINVVAALIANSGLK